MPSSSKSVSSWLALIYGTLCFLCVRSVAMGRNTNSHVFEQSSSSSSTTESPGSELSTKPPLLLFAANTLASLDAARAVIAGSNSPTSIENSSALLDEAVTNPTPLPTRFFSLYVDSFLGDGENDAKDVSTTTSLFTGSLNTEEENAFATQLALGLKAVLPTSANGSETNTSTATSSSNGQQWQASWNNDAVQGIRVEELLSSVPSYLDPYGLDTWVREVLSVREDVGDTSEYSNSLSFGEDGATQSKPPIIAPPLRYVKFVLAGLPTKSSDLANASDPSSTSAGRSSINRIPTVIMDFSLASTIASAAARSLLPVGSRQQTVGAQQQRLLGTVGSVISDGRKRCFAPNLDSVLLARLWVPPAAMAVPEPISSSSSSSSGGGVAGGKALGLAEGCSTTSNSSLSTCYEYRNFHTSFGLAGCGGNASFLFNSQGTASYSPSCGIQQGGGEQEKGGLLSSPALTNTIPIRFIAFSDSSRTEKMAVTAVTVTIACSALVLVLFFGGFFDALLLMWQLHTVLMFALNSCAPRWVGRIFSDVSWLLWPTNVFLLGPKTPLSGSRSDPLRISSELLLQSVGYVAIVIVALLINYTVARVAIYFSRRAALRQSELSANTYEPVLVASVYPDEATRANERMHIEAALRGGRGRGGGEQGKMEMGEAYPAVVERQAGTTLASVADAAANRNTVGGVEGVGSALDGSLQTGALMPTWRGRRRAGDRGSISSRGEDSQNNRQGAVTRSRISSGLGGFADLLTGRSQAPLPQSHVEGGGLGFITLAATGGAIGTNSFAGPPAVRRTPRGTLLRNDSRSVTPICSGYSNDMSQYSDAIGSEGEAEEKEEDFLSLYEEEEDLYAAHLPDLIGAGNDPKTIWSLLSPEARARFPAIFLLCALLMLPGSVFGASRVFSLATNVREEELPFSKDSITDTLSAYTYGYGLASSSSNSSGRSTSSASSAPPPSSSDNNSMNYYLGSPPPLSVLTIQDRLLLSRYSFGNGASYSLYNNASSRDVVSSSVASVREYGDVWLAPLWALAFTSCVSMLVALGMLYLSFMIIMRVVTREHFKRDYSFGVRGSGGVGGGSGSSASWSLYEGLHLKKSGAWVSVDSQRKYGLLYDGLDGGSFWFQFPFVAVMIIVSIVAGQMPLSPKGCTGNAYVQLIVATANLVVMGIRKPYICVSFNVLNIIVSAAHVLTAISFVMTSSCDPSGYLFSWTITWLWLLMLLIKSLFVVFGHSMWAYRNYKQQKKSKGSLLSRRNGEGKGDGGEKGGGTSRSRKKTKGGAEAQVDSPTVAAVIGKTTKGKRATATNDDEEREMSIIDDVGGDTNFGEHNFLGTHAAGGSESTNASKISCRPSSFVQHPTYFSTLLNGVDIGKDVVSFLLETARTAEGEGEGDHHYDDDVNGGGKRHQNSFGRVLHNEHRIAQQRSGMQRTSFSLVPFVHGDDPLADLSHRYTLNQVTTTIGHMGDGAPFTSSNQNKIKVKINARALIPVGAMGGCSFLTTTTAKDQKPLSASNIAKASESCCFVSPTTTGSTVSNSAPMLMMWSPRGLCSSQPAYSTPAHDTTQARNTHMFVADGASCCVLQVNVGSATSIDTQYVKSGGASATGSEYDTAAAVSVVVSREMLESAAFLLAPPSARKNISGRVADSERRNTHRRDVAFTQSETNNSQSSEIFRTKKQHKHYQQQRESSSSSRLPRVASVDSAIKTIGIAPLETVVGCCCVGACSRSETSNRGEGRSDHGGKGREKEKESMTLFVVANNGIYRLNLFQYSQTAQKDGSKSAVSEEEQLPKQHDITRSPRHRLPVSSSPSASPLLLCIVPVFKGGGPIKETLHVTKDDQRQLHQEEVGPGEESAPRRRAGALAPFYGRTSSENPSSRNDRRATTTTTTTRTTANTNSVSAVYAERGNARLRAVHSHSTSSVGGEGSAAMKRNVETIYPLLERPAGACVYTLPQSNYLLRGVAEPSRQLLFIADPKAGAVFAFRADRDPIPMSIHAARDASLYHGYCDRSADRRASAAVSFAGSGFSSSSLPFSLPYRFAPPIATVPIVPLLVGVASPKFLRSFFQQIPPSVEERLEVENSEIFFGNRKKDTRFRGVLSEGTLVAGGQEEGGQQTEKETEELMAHTASPRPPIVPNNYLSSAASPSTSTTTTTILSPLPLPFSPSTLSEGLQTEAAPLNLINEGWEETQKKEKAKTSIIGNERKIFGRVVDHRCRRYASIAPESNSAEAKSTVGFFPFLKVPVAVCVSHVREELYIADSDAHVVWCVSLSGLVLGERREENETVGEASQSPTNTNAHLANSGMMDPTIEIGSKDPFAHHRHAIAGRFLFPKAHPEMSIVAGTYGVSDGDDGTLHSSHIVPKHGNNTSEGKEASEERSPPASSSSTQQQQHTTSISTPPATTGTKSSSFPSPTSANNHHNSNESNHYKIRRLRESLSSTTSPKKERNTTRREATPSFPSLGRNQAEPQMATSSLSTSMLSFPVDISFVESAQQLIVIDCGHRGTPAAEAVLAKANKAHHEVSQRQGTTTAPTEAENENLKRLRSLHCGRVWIIDLSKTLSRFASPILLLPPTILGGVRDGYFVPRRVSVLDVLCGEKVHSVWDERLPLPSATAFRGEHRSSGSSHVSSQKQRQPTHTENNTTKMFPPLSLVLSDPFNGILMRLDAEVSITNREEGNSDGNAAALKATGHTITNNNPLVSDLPRADASSHSDRAGEQGLSRRGERVHLESSFVGKDDNITHHTYRWGVVSKFSPRDDAVVGSSVRIKGGATTFSGEQGGRKDILIARRTVNFNENAMKIAELSASVTGIDPSFPSSLSTSSPRRRRWEGSDLLQSSLFPAVEPKLSSPRASSFSTKPSAPLRPRILFSSPPTTIKGDNTDSTVTSHPLIKGEPEETLQQVGPDKLDEDIQQDPTYKGVSGMPTFTTFDSKERESKSMEREGEARGGVESLDLSDIILNMETNRRRRNNIERAFSGASAGGGDSILLLLDYDGVQLNTNADAEHVDHSSSDNGSGSESHGKKRKEDTNPHDYYDYDEDTLLIASHFNTREELLGNGLRKVTNKNHSTRKTNHLHHKVVARGARLRSAFSFSPSPREHTTRGSPVLVIPKTEPESESPPRRPRGGDDSASTTPIITTPSFRMISADRPENALVALLEKEGTDEIKKEDHVEALDVLALPLLDGDDDNEHDDLPHLYHREHNIVEVVESDPDDSELLAHFESRRQILRGRALSGGQRKK